MRWVRRIFVVLFVLVAALAAAGFSYQLIADRWERRAPAPGALVDVGGYRLHLTCAESGSGGHPGFGSRRLFRGMAERCRFRCELHPSLRLRPGRPGLQ